MSNKINATDMNQVRKRELKPKLRFPEFRDAGEWELRFFSEWITEIESGVSVNSYDTPVENSLDIGVLKTSCVFGGFFNPDENKKINESEVNLVKINPLKNTILVSRMNTPQLVGESGYVYRDYLNLFLPDRLWRISCDETILITKLFSQYLSSGTIRASLKLAASGTSASMKNISKPTFLSFKLKIPSIPAEQQKIADCLSSIDDHITAENQKLNTLKAHKKGLMQQLLPAEGETLPKLRFPQFRDAGKWTKQKVSNLLKKVSNPVNVDLDKLYQQIGIRSHGKGIFHKEPVSGKELGNKRVFWVEENAFVVNIVFAWEQAVANTSQTEEGMIASHRFPMYKAKPNKSDVTYIKYFFLTSQGKNLLRVASPGGAGRNKTLGQKEFENLEFVLPENVEEQKKIADCLSSLDELIAAQAQKIDSLKVHKKGLMQQLFPAIEEVKG